MYQGHDAGNALSPRRIKATSDVRRLSIDVRRFVANASTAGDDRAAAFDLLTGFEDGDVLLEQVGPGEIGERCALPGCEGGGVALTSASRYTPSQLHAVLSE